MRGSRLAFCRLSIKAADGTGIAAKHLADDVVRQHLEQLAAGSHDEHGFVGNRRTARRREVGGEQQRDRQDGRNANQGKEQGQTAA